MNVIYKEDHKGKYNLIELIELIEYLYKEYHLGYVSRFLIVNNGVKYLTKILEMNFDSKIN